MSDRNWERIQQKTFTGWCNSHLRKRAMTVENILEDFSDGLKLINLLEIISGEPFGKKYDKKPKMRIQKVQNVGYCLQFIKEHNVALAGTGAEEIVDGNKVMILGMIWTIILRFAIADISLEELSARDALLRWCQRKTEPYDDVNVKNFTFSFQDGLAFCALIHRHRPDLLDYDALDKSDKIGNMNKAFDVAAEHLDVPKLLDAEDIVDSPKPDERSVITYVAMLYHVFASGEKAEIAGRRVAKVIDFANEMEKLKDDYNYRAKDLAQWIDNKTGELGNREFACDSAGVRGQIGEMRDFQTGEKAQKAGEKSDLESAYSSLQTKLKLNNRPAFVPPEGLSPKDIDNAWNGLENAESDRLKALREEFRRLKKVEDLVRRFNLKTEKMEAWAAAKTSFLGSAELGDDISSVSANIKNHQAFEGEYAARGEGIQSLSKQVDELQAENYCNMADVNGKLDHLKGSWAGLKTAGDDRLGRLNEKLAQLQQVEELLLDFAKKALGLRAWIETADDVLTEPISVDSVAAIDTVKADYDQVVSEYGAKQADYDELSGLADKCSAAGVSSSTYSEVSWDDLTASWANIGSLIQSRSGEIDEEKSKQESNEQLRIAFAEVAKEFLAYTQAQSVELTETTGDAETQLAALEAKHTELAGENARLEKVNESYSALEAAGIQDNAHTNVTYQDCAREWDRLTHKIQEQIALIQAQVLEKEGSSLSAEQVAEFKDCFQHFDKDKDGLLDRLELGACLRSLGEEINLEERGGRLDKLLEEIADEGNEDGKKVSFTAFKAYMEKVSADSDTPEQIVEAFRVIAGDKDFVTEADLRRVLPQDKVAYCLAHMKAYPGAESENGYDYSTFTGDLYA